MQKRAGLGERSFRSSKTLQLMTLCVPHLFATNWPFACLLAQSSAYQSFFYHQSFMLSLCSGRSHLNLVFCELWNDADSNFVDKCIDTHQRWRACDDRTPKMIYYLCGGLISGIWNEKCFFGDASPSSKDHLGWNLMAPRMWWESFLNWPDTFYRMAERGFKLNFDKDPLPCW